MATTNSFDILGDDDTGDITQLLQNLPPPVKKSPAPVESKLPSKPLPPAQAVRKGRTDGQRGGGRTGGRGSRDGRFDRDSADNEESFRNNGFSSGYRQSERGHTQSEDGVVEKSSQRRGYGGPRGDFNGARRGYNNREVSEGEHPPQKVYEHHSGTACGNEYTKYDGAGRGNWGTPTDDITKETEKPVSDGQENPNIENQLSHDDAGDANKENPVTKAEEKEPEVKEMTLEEYEKVLEEKRKALVALKSEERKVDLDKDFESMQLLSSKKNDEGMLVKLGTDKDKYKEATEKEKARKAVNLVEFLKPAEGERYYGHGSRGGRGRGARGGNHGFGGRNRMNNFAPAIEDAAQFPTLGAAK